ncbi:LOW QUALITY PROTEIN: hypothetical protein BRADI_1g28291v3 [Brachypodium distachyon]|uniref:DUF834 domain-containing protein n=1 Tax=Brachypodium distachyon TaxID=15368 RepID=A0A0Q3GZP6_BRADI|nr:LOW QUALITY PROTEIN: hypothetical protein BRADI_1g28291v3 [Brachypodium distachyon]
MRAHRSFEQITAEEAADGVRRRPSEERRGGAASGGRRRVRGQGRLHAGEELLLEAAEKNGRLWARGSTTGGAFAGGGEDRRARFSGVLRGRCRDAVLAGRCGEGDWGWGGTGTAGRARRNPWQTRLRWGKRRGEGRELHERGKREENAGEGIRRKEQLEVMIKTSGGYRRRHGVEQWRRCASSGWEGDGQRRRTKAWERNRHVIE